MRSKIRLNEQSGRTVAEVFDDFVFAQTAEGLSEVTIRNYKLHLHSISKHLDIQQPMKELTNRQLEEMIVSMRKSGLAHNSISAYARVFRTFLNWCQRQGVASLTMPHITDKETVKETYTDKNLRYCSKSQNQTVPLRNIETGSLSISCSIAAAVRRLCGTSRFGMWT